MNNFSGSGKVCVAPKAGRTTMNTDFVKFIVQIERPSAEVDESMLPFDIMGGYYG